MTKAFRGISILILLAIPVAPSRAGDRVDTGGALLAHAVSAIGGQAWSRVGILHRRLCLDAAGLSGSEDLWIEPATGRYASAFRLGPDHGAEGWDGREGWSVDRAGRVSLLSGEALALLRATAFASSFAWLSPAGLAVAGARHEVDRRAYGVVLLAPEGAGPVELWVDPDSGLPARAVLPGPAEVTLRFEEWRRQPGGIFLPERLVRSDGDPRYDREMRASVTEPMTSFASDPFAPPPPAPPDYRFGAGLHRSTMDLQATGDAYLIDVRIDGKGPFRFGLDTGARDALDAGLAAELGLTVAGRLHGQGAGASAFDVGLTVADTVGIGDLELRDQLFTVLPLVFGGGEYVPPYRGLLGAEVFQRFIVRIDQDRKEASFEEPEGWQHQGAGEAVPLRFHGYVPLVDGTIDGVAGAFTLDTGQANSLTLYRPFLRLPGVEAHWSPMLTAPVGWGAGGDIMAEIARGRRLMLGKVPFDNPVIYLSQQEAGAFADPAVSGNVGQGSLSRFDLVFDYAHRQVWFEPGRGYERGDELHIMTVERSDFGLTVLSVMRGGAAALAGLRPGDRIEEIDGHDAALLENRELEHFFNRAPGTEVRLLVHSKGELRSAVLVLRPAV